MASMGVLAARKKVTGIDEILAGITDDKERARTERMIRAWNEHREISHRTFGLIIENTEKRHPGILNGLFKGIELPGVDIVPEDYELPPNFARLLTDDHAIACARHYLGAPNDWGTLEDERILFRNGRGLTGYELFPFQVGRLAKDSDRLDALKGAFVRLVGPYVGFRSKTEELNAELNGVFDMIPRAERGPAHVLYDRLLLSFLSRIPFVHLRDSVTIDINYFRNDELGIHYVPDIVGDLYTLGVLVSAIEITFDKGGLHVEQLRSPFSREVEEVKLGLPGQEGIGYSYDNCEFETGQYHTYRLSWERRRPFMIGVQAQLESVVSVVAARNARKHPEFVTARAISIEDAGVAALQAQRTADEASARALEEATRRAADAEAHAEEETRLRGEAEDLARQLQVQVRAIEHEMRGTGGVDLRRRLEEITDALRQAGAYIQGQEDTGEQERAFTEVMLALSNSFVVDDRVQYWQDIIYSLTGVSEGRLAERREEIDLAELVESYATRMHEILRRKAYVDNDGEIPDDLRGLPVYEPTQEELYISGERRGIRIVLDNIFRNSIDAGKGNANRVHFRVSSEREADQEYSVVTIQEEDGRGMDAETVRGFEQGTLQIGHASNRRMGHIIVKMYMDSHDGFVKVQSELGVGTTTQLYFPKI